MLFRSGSVITFYHEDGRVLLKEHFRRLRDEESMPLNIMGREYSNGVGDNFRIVAQMCIRDRNESMKKKNCNDSEPCEMEEKSRWDSEQLRKI